MNRIQRKEKKRKEFYFDNSTLDPRDPPIEIFKLEWRIGVGNAWRSLSTRRGTSVKVARKPRIPVSVPREWKSKVTSAMPRSFFTHGEFVAPNGEPLDVGHRLPVRQRERDVLPSIPLQRVRSIAEIDRIGVFFLQAGTRFGSGCFRRRSSNPLRAISAE